jgi:hypothetical protein
VRTRIADARALEAERARAKPRPLVSATNGWPGRAAAEAAAAELARKEAERRGVRLLELVAEARPPRRRGSAVSQATLRARAAWWKDLTVDAAADAIWPRDSRRGNAADRPGRRIEENDRRARAMRSTACISCSPASNRSRAGTICP